METMVFMMIFGAALLLAAGSMVLSKDPRNSILLYKVQGLKSMPREQAKVLAEKIAKITAADEGCPLYRH